MGQAASLSASSPSRAPSPAESQVPPPAQSQVTPPDHSLHSFLNPQSRSLPQSQPQPHSQALSLSPQHSKQQQQQAAGAAHHSLDRTPPQPPQSLLHGSNINTKGPLRGLLHSSTSSTKLSPKGLPKTMNSIKVSGKCPSPTGTGAAKGVKSPVFRTPLALQMAFLMTLVGIALAALMVSEKMGKGGSLLTLGLLLPKEVGVTVSGKAAPGSVTVKGKRTLMVSERMGTRGSFLSLGLPLPGDQFLQRALGDAVSQGTVTSTAVTNDNGSTGSVTVQGKRPVTAKGKGTAGPAVVNGKGATGVVTVKGKGNARPLPQKAKQGPVTVKGKGKTGPGTVKGKGTTGSVTVTQVGAQGKGSVPAQGKWKPRNAPTAKQDALRLKDQPTGGTRPSASAQRVQSSTPHNNSGANLLKIPAEILDQILEMEAHEKEQKQNQELEFLIAGEDKVQASVRPQGTNGSTKEGHEGGQGSPDSWNPLNPFQTRWEDEGLLKDRVWEGVSRDDAWLFERAMRTDEEPWKGRWETRLKELKRKAANGGNPRGGGVHPKVAFLFLTRGPLPLALFWAQFFQGHEGKYSIFIHTAEKFKYPAGSLPPAFQGRQIRSQDVKWGHINVVDAERRLLGNALLDPLNARFVLVSESCIPLYNFSFIYNTLVNSKESFLHVGSEMGRSGIGRWNEGFKPLIPINLWRKGSQWFQITRPVARSIVGDALFYPKFRDHCTHQCHADEHYLPTMLNALRTPHLARRDLTWTDWSRGGCHPRTFNRGEISMRLLRKIRSIKAPTCSSHCFLFARKFAPQALGPLLRLKL